MNRLFLATGVFLAMGLALNQNTTASAQVAEKAEVLPGGAIGDQSTAGIEVMTRGPIHEGFAEPINTGAVRPLVAPRQPPAPIPEEPSATKPADENAIWINGYWSWDDDRNDFVWISGTWRVPPPGQRWIAGYWTRASGGVQWVPGLWWPAENQEIAYYPEPPQARDEGPPGDPPSANDFWVPGCWHWSDAGYTWQAGHWATGQPGWVWTAPSYSWCPQGWIFRDGYWDYPLARRGLVFAPVYLARGVYSRPHFFYSPSFAIDPAVLAFHLFVRPSHGHYYFGDYYAPRYDRLGIYPWFSVFRHGHYAYDPIFSYYGWHYRSRDPLWHNNLVRWHEYYRAHEDRRPPHNLTAQRSVLAAAGNRPDRAFLSIAQTAQDWQRRPDAPVRVASVSATERTALREEVRRVREVQTQRERMETGAVAGIQAQRGQRAETPGARKAPQKMSLSQLPVVGPSQARTPRIATRPGDTRPETPRATPEKAAPPRPDVKRKPSGPREAPRPVPPPPGPRRSDDGAKEAGKAPPPPPPPQAEGRSQPPAKKAPPEPARQGQRKGAGEDKDRPARK